MAGPSPTSGWYTANMLTLAQQRNLRDRQRNYRIPLRWTDCVLQATRTHRQFGAHFTFTTVTEEAMRRDRRSLRHVFRETVCVPNSSSADRRSAHCRGRRSDISIRKSDSVYRVDSLRRSFNELFLQSSDSHSVLLNHYKESVHINDLFTNHSIVTWSWHGNSSVLIITHRLNNTCEHKFNLTLKTYSYILFRGRLIFVYVHECVFLCNVRLTLREMYEL